MGHYSGGLRRVCKRGYQGAVKLFSTASLSRNGHVPQVPPVKPIELSSKRIHLSLFICSHFGSSAPVFYLHAAAMPAERKNKTKGCDVASHTLTDLFNSHIPLASCKPRELWKLDRINAAGHTSEWAVIQRNSQLISELLEVTSGRIPHQKTLAPALDAWLRDKGIQWAYTDTDRAALHLRTMLMSLVRFRRNSSKKFPFKHQSLQVLADKIHQSDDEGGPACPSAGSQESACEPILPAPAKRITIQISDPPTPEPAPEISLDDLDWLEKNLFGQTSSAARKQRVFGDSSFPEGELGNADANPVMPADFTKNGQKPAAEKKSVLRRPSAAAAAAAPVAAPKKRPPASAKTMKAMETKKIKPTKTMTPKRQTLFGAASTSKDQRRDKNITRGCTRRFGTMNEIAA